MRGILETGSLDAYVHSEGVLTYLFLFLLSAIVYAATFHGASGISGDIVFVVSGSQGNDGPALCQQLRAVRLAIFEKRFRMEAAEGPMCDTPPQTWNANRIYLYRTCQNDSAQSGFVQGQRAISICWKSVNAETLPHEYLHHRHGHVGLPYNAVKYIFSEICILLELILRVFIRLGILPAAAALFWYIRWRRRRLAQGGQPFDPSKALVDLAIH